MEHNAQQTAPAGGTEHTDVNSCQRSWKGRRSKGLTGTWVPPQQLLSPPEDVQTNQSCSSKSQHTIHPYARCQSPRGHLLNCFIFYRESEVFPIIKKKNKDFHQSASIFASSDTHHVDMEIPPHKPFLVGLVFVPLFKVACQL